MLKNYIRHIALFVVLKKTSITKDVNRHSLRHSYATHLPGQGLNFYNHAAIQNLGFRLAPEEKPMLDKKANLPVPQETNLQRFVRLTGYDPCICPVCKSGRVAVGREWSRIRSPCFHISYFNFRISYFVFRLCSLLPALCWH